MDIRCLEYLDLLTITDVRPADNALPAIVVSGNNMGSASSVTVNGVPCKDIAVVSNEKVLVSLPRNLWLDPIDDISVFGSNDRGSIKTRLGFTIDNGKKTEGLQKLIQWFIKLLLQTPGSDSFDPIGGGLLSLVGRTYDMDSVSNVRRQLVLNTAIIAGELVKRQTNSKAPLSERLNAVDILDVDFNSPTATIFIRLALSNQLGEQGFAGIVNNPGRNYD